MSINGFKFGVGPNQLFFRTDTTFERRQPKHLKCRGGTKHGGHQCRTTRGQNEHFFGRLQTGGEVGPPKQFHGVNAQHRQCRNAAPNHAMGNAANQYRHHRNGGEPHGVRCLNAPPNQQEEQVALKIVSRQQVSEHAWTPPPSGQKWNGHKKQPRPQHDDGFFGVLHVEKQQHEWKPRTAHQQRCRNDGLNLERLGRFGLVALGHEPRHKPLKRPDN